MSEPTSSSSPGNDLIAAVEAVLFAAAEPVHPKEIAAAFSGATESEVAAAIDALRDRYAVGPGG
jgi:chromosome segregation and condensation protein ScpB